MSSRDPYSYLRTADNLLIGGVTSGQSNVEGGWWPKACAGLTRLALEAALDDYWLVRMPSVAACGTGRTKLLMLRRFVGVDVARRASYAWAVLSRMTHQQCYDAPPSAGELRRLHTTVHALLGQLAYAAPARRGQPMGEHDDYLTIKVDVRLGR